MSKGGWRGRTLDGALLDFHLQKQAFVSAVDDDFLVAGIITLLCVVPFLFLRKRSQPAPGMKVLAMD